MSDIHVLSQISTDFPVEWYENAQEGHFWFEWRMEALLHQLKSLGISQNEWLKVLDIGCGYGLLRRQLEKHSSWIIDGVELNRVALENNHTRQGKNILYNINDRKETFKESYDILILFDVLEHIEDTQAFLESALFHLKKGGLLLINVPALNQSLSQYDRVVGHLRRYNQSMLTHELRESGVSIIDMRYWGLFMLPLLILRKWFPLRNASTEEIIQKGLNPPTIWINRLLLIIMKLETNLFKKPILGTSLLAVVKK